MSAPFDLFRWHCPVCPPSPESSLGSSSEAWLEDYVEQHELVVHGIEAAA